jgi:hypothetical protein
MLKTIEMKSPVMVVTKINKKTNAFMFKDLTVGSLIQITADVGACGVSPSGSSYAPILQIENIQEENSAWKSFNELARILECFEFEEFLTD